MKKRLLNQLKNSTQLRVSKFKIGDTIRFILGEDEGLKIKEIGVICGITDRYAEVTTEKGHKLWADLVTSCKLDTNQS